jgi:hypothetical protein
MDAPVRSPPTAGPVVQRLLVNRPSIGRVAVMIDRPHKRFIVTERLNSPGTDSSSMLIDFICCNVRNCFFDFTGPKVF